RIVRAIIAYGRGSSWVGDGTAGADDVQRWVMQRQGQAPEWQDARIHEQVHVVVQRSFAFEKPERIAAPQAHGAEAEHPAPATGKAAPPAQALVWPERQAAAHPNTFRLEERSFAGAFRSQ